MSSVDCGVIGHSYGDGLTAIVTRDGVSDPLVDDVAVGCTALAPLYSDTLIGASEMGPKHESYYVDTSSMCANGSSNEPSVGRLLCTMAEYGMSTAMPFTEVFSLYAV